MLTTTTVGLGLFALANQVAYLESPKQAPDMVCFQGAEDEATIPIFDGLLGYPVERTERVRRLGAFGNHPLLIADPRGDRYSLEVAAAAAYLQLKNEKVQSIVPMGFSMGAKTVRRLLQLIEEDTEYNPTIKGVVLVDPLHDGNGIKGGAAAKAIRFLQWRVGWLANTIDAGAGRFAARKFMQAANTPYELRARQASLRWIVTQVREAAGPAVPGELKAPPPVKVLRCGKDDVLHFQGELELAWYKGGGITPVPDTTHVSLDNPDHVEIWADAIREALATL